MNSIGAAGSPTAVHEIREMVVNRERRVVSGEPPALMARQLVDFLMKRGMFTPWENATAPTPVRPTPSSG